MLTAPPYKLALKIQVLPPEVPHCSDPMPGFMRQDESRAEELMNLLRYPEQRLVLRRREHWPASVSYTHLTLPTILRV